MLMKITKMTECTRVPVRNMERATLANRCIIIEADKRFKETDIKQIFSNVVQLTALKKETTTELPQVRTTSYGLQSFRYAGTKR